MLDPADIIERAHEFRDAGQLDRAITMLTVALSDDLNNVTLLSHLAPMLAEAGRESRAQAMFERALGQTDSATLRINYGTLLAQMGQLDRAVGVLSDAVVRLTADPFTVGPLTASEELILHAQCMWAQVELDQGHPQVALDRVTPFVGDPDQWQGVSDIVWSALEAMEADPDPYVMACYRRKCISPDLVFWHLENLRDEGHPIGKQGFAVMVSDALLWPDWHLDHPGLLPLLKAIRSDLGLAIIRGDDAPLLADAAATIDAL